MKQRIRHHAGRLVGLGLAWLVMAGCGSGRSELDILPSEDKARAALETALAAWQNGQAHGKLQGSSHGIEVVDRVWQAGGKLTSFEILQAEDKPGPRWFSVKLTLKNAPQPQQVRYAVLGLDPLWVYREEDYNQSCGMGS
jgi:hypothetical protein